MTKRDVWLLWSVKQLTSTDCNLLCLFIILDFVEYIFPMEFLSELFCESVIYGCKITAQRMINYSTSDG